MVRSVFLLRPSLNIRPDWLHNIGNYILCNYLLSSLDDDMRVPGWWDSSVAEHKGRICDGQGLNFGYPGVP